LRPLDDIRVLDFTTLLPGPFATLVLAEAGAEVIKIEPPGGDPVRHRAPKLGEASVFFAALNRGKRSIEIDLKAPGGAARLTPLIETADVLVEQFRPGVMARLGLDYDAVRAVKPDIVYCSITGYGQSGPRVQVAGHDLNYVAETGLLSMTRARDGAPVLPHTQIADIGAGSYPAVISILTALWQRARSGEGRHLDISMTDNLFPFLWYGLAPGHAVGEWPEGADTPMTGLSPRYQVYETLDGRWIAVGAREQKFWDAFCEAIGLEARVRDDARDPAATIAAVADRIATRSAEDWQARFGTKDVCAVVMASLEEAVQSAHFRLRGLFDHEVADGGRAMPAVPVPLAGSLREAPARKHAPRLGEANALLDEAPARKTAAR
jgi:alpha-methylacyl-CoA racemase